MKFLSLCSGSMPITCAGARAAKLKPDTMPGYDVRQGITEQLSTASRQIYPYLLIFLSAPVNMFLPLCFVSHL